MHAASAARPSLRSCAVKTPSSSDILTDWGCGKGGRFRVRRGAMCCIQLPRRRLHVTQVTAAPSGTHTRAMGSGSSPVRLHWRAQQQDVDTGEGPR